MAELETVVEAATNGAETPTEEKVTFDERQKARVNELIKDAMGRAGREAKEHAAELERELSTLRANLPTEEPNLALELDTTRAELKALKAEKQETAIKDALRSAAGDAFVDTDLAIRLMRDRVSVDKNGKITVLAADGTTPALGATLEPATLSELAQTVANERKYLARGVTKPGIGSSAALSHAPTGPKLEDLFGPKSNGGLANQLAMRSPSEYRRLKALAREKGICR